MPGFRQSGPSALTRPAAAVRAKFADGRNWLRLRGARLTVAAVALGGLVWLVLPASPRAKNTDELDAAFVDLLDASAAPAPFAVAERPVRMQPPADLHRIPDPRPSGPILRAGGFSVGPQTSGARLTGTIEAIPGDRD